MSFSISASRAVARRTIVSSTAVARRTMVSSTATAASHTAAFPGTAGFGPLASSDPAAVRAVMPPDAHAAATRPVLRTMNIAWMPGCPVPKIASRSGGGTRVH